MVRRVETRWIQLLVVVSQLLEQLPALKEYFFNTVPRERKIDMTNNRVIKICQAMKNPILEVELNFLKAVLPITEKFEKVFQKSSCEIHK